MSTIAVEEVGVVQVKLFWWIFPLLLFGTVVAGHYFDSSGYDSHYLITNGGYGNTTLEFVVTDVVGGDIESNLAIRYGLYNQYVVEGIAVGVPLSSSCLIKQQYATPIDFPANYSLINWSAILTNATINSGNYTWNFSQYGVLAFNVTEYVFNFTSNCSSSYVQMAINKTEEWYDVKCNDVSIGETYTNVAPLTENNSIHLNCTMDFINISQTYVNWTVANNRATWDINFSYQLIE